MSRDDKPIPHRLAYNDERRRTNMEWFIGFGAANGFLETTQSRFVSVTYGVDQSAVKEVKARHRNELSFSPEGK